MARFTVKLVLPALFVLSALAAGCGGRASKTPVADTSTSIATARVHARTWPSTFEAGGIVRARTTATIASRMLAPVMTVHVHAGDHVRRGAPLVTLEAREMTATQARAQAASSGSDDEVRTAEATVRSADAALTFAQATHDRVRTLFEKRSATAHELDQARAALDEARAQLASARRRRPAPGPPPPPRRRQRRCPTRRSSRHSTGSSPSARSIPVTWRCRARRCSPWKTRVPHASM
jgi:multidrug resistance efflux pump